MTHLNEYRRLSGVGPSLMEATAADPMLGVLAKAFSVKSVAPADVKFLRFRKSGKGIELEDMAERLGGILTSVEPSDADPKALVAFLKKHGAKGMKSESMDESTRYVVMRGDEAEAIYKIKSTGGRGWVFVVKTSDGGKTWEKVRGFDDHKDTGLRDAYAWLDKRPGLKRFGKRGATPHWVGESLDEQVYSVLGPGPKASAESDVAKFCADIERGVQSAVRGKFFRCRPNLKFGVGGANIDYANIPATEQPGSLAFLNAKVQVRLTVDGFDAEGNLKGSKIKVEKLTSPHGIKFRAKTGTVGQVVKHIVSTIKAAAALNESLDEAETPANIILKQMGGSGRLKAMIGAKHFTSHDGGKALSFQFPNKQRSKGNYVKVTLRGDDTYDMEFLAISGGGTKVKKVKTYSGIMADQLKSLFTQWTGLYLHL